MMLQGSGYMGWIDQVFGLVLPPPTGTVTNTEQMTANGADVLGKWTHTISDTADFKLQV